MSDYSVSLATNTVTVDSRGLQWLQWTETRGKSVSWFNTSSESQSLRSEGWQLANNSQMADLY